MHIYTYIKFPLFSPATEYCNAKSNRAIWLLRYSTRNYLYEAFIVHGIILHHFLFIHSIIVHVIGVHHR